MASSTEPSASLEYTPTWVVALVFSVIFFFSLFMERLLHHLGKVFERKGQNALFEALQKLKEELMLLGFISLLLTVFQNLISRICIPASVTNHMLPCKRVEGIASQHEILHMEAFSLVHNRRRLLSQGSDSGHCTAEGKVPLLSLEAVHQLQIFIFVLAVVHVVFCATTMVLGGAKIQRWKHWEKSIRSESLKFENGEHAMHYHPHIQFLREHTMGFWRRSAVVSWIMAFFKQFHSSVTRSDYISLRHGFIMKHCEGSPRFDFHKFMMMTLESNFKKVVGISWYLWLFVVIFLSLNVDGWHTYFWLSFLPLVLLLIVGAKLEHIIARLAQDAVNDHGEEGAPRVKPSDEHFWFQRPGIVLYIIHFILFQNAFEIAFFFWILCTYGFDSCILENVAYVIPRLVIGLAVQLLCSYNTLPLYAIVTQMGESFKQEIFDDQLRALFYGWLDDVRKKRSGGRLSSALNSLGLRKKKSDASSGGEVLMQRMESGMFRTVPSDRHHPAVLEGITIPEMEHSGSIQPA